MDTARLLEPLTLGARTAPSRLLFGPHVTNMGRDRDLTPRHAAYYARRAEAGCGVIVTETASVHESDWPYERAPLASACAAGWAAVARACAGSGALVVAGLGHSGGQGSSAFSRAAMWAPSGVAEVNAREMPKVMEPDEMEAVIRGFGEAARRSVEAGLDGVEVNAGQSSLVRQFLSGLTNHRDDEWGTDRMLFARDVLTAVRHGVDDGVVGLRLCIDELAPWAGITPESAIAIAKELARQVDYLVLVRGSIYSATATRPDAHEAPGFNLEATAAVRAALGGVAPVYAQGSIVDPAMAVAAIANGMADGVEMTRAQIADGELVRKLRDGRAAEIRPCVLCNQACQVQDGRNPIVTCIGDPRSGYETEEPDVERDRRPPREIRIVGAGPAGLEAARIAATRGHRVTLLERRAHTGGALRLAAAIPGRERFAALADWLESECRRLEVEIHTRFDAPVLEGVLACVGGVDGEVSYRIEDGEVVSAATLLESDPTPEGPVVVWDPIGGPVGVGVAELLALRGFSTTLVTPDQIAGTLLSLSGDLVAANGRLRRAGVEIVRRAVLRVVREGEVVVEDRFGGGTRVLPAALVVDAGHRLAAATPEEAIAAGDAVAPRTVLEAILEGRRAALAVERTARPAVPA
jgi:2,4-dienoyl-CoA reductase (NADPH2)